MFFRIGFEMAVENKKDARSSDILYEGGAPLNSAKPASKLMTGTHV